MKRLTLVLALILSLAFAGHVYALPSTVAGNVTVDVIGSAEFLVVSYKILPDPAGDVIVGDDLGGDMDYGTIDTTVVLDPATNPYGAGIPRTASDHYAQVRFYCNNNLELWKVNIVVSDGGDPNGIFVNLAAPGGSTNTSILHFQVLKIDDFNEPPPAVQLTTAHPANLVQEGVTRDVVENTAHDLYDASIDGVPTNDLFVMLMFMDNISTSVSGGSYVGTIAYNMVATP